MVKAYKIPIDVKARCVACVNLYYVASLSGP